MEWKMQLFVARQARIRFIASKIGLAKKTMAPVREIRGPYVVGGIIGAALLFVVPAAVIPVFSRRSQRNWQNYRKERLEEERSRRLEEENMSAAGQKTPNE